MFEGLEIGFERPWYLLLLLALPFIWILSFNSLAGLGRWRRLLALLFRTLVFSLLVFALANTQWRQSTDRLTVIFLLDQSDSIPANKRSFMAEYAFQAVKQQRRKNKEDMAGVITFGANAKIEAAPYDDDLPLIGRLETSEELNTGQTSLEAALKLAKASFPENTARRVVVISDGNENLGDALALAASMADDGISLDVLPVNLLATSEVSVDKVVIPSDVRRGENFETRVVITNDTEPSENNPTGVVKGKLRLIQKTPQNEEQVAEEIVELAPGKNIRGFKHKIDRASILTYEATFVPLDPTQDMVVENNQASAFTHVRGEAKILLIEDGNDEGEFIHLISALQSADIEVDVMPSTDLFSQPTELLQYDSVVLANVPRATGETVEGTESFSDEQIEMLVKNCEELGCGLVMIGGDRSFGAGGWSNTAIEKAMPVDFQIKNDKVDAVGALAMMMHASEMPDGNLWQTRICTEAIKVLGPMDYCGVVEWSGRGVSRWLWKLPKGVDRVYQNRRRMLGMVAKLTPGDMPEFKTPMQLALNGLVKTNASMKHMIIISDGDPVPPSNQLLAKYVKAKIKISTVACGTHMNQNNPLRKIAKVTGGKYWEVRNPNALPIIFQREARRVAKPLIKESRQGIPIRTTSNTSSHEMTRGIDFEQLPTIGGFVMTTVKQNMLVQQLALSSDPNDNGENSTLLATWRYGNGNATVFTADAGHKWTASWLNNDQYSKLFVQMIRHSMRPITQDANFSIATEVRDNKARIVVTALDKDDEFINFLELTGRGLDPTMQGFDLPFTQVAPGRYVAETDATNSGNYLFSIIPGEGFERLTAGANVPYSSEYTDRETNAGLLDSLVQFPPRGGEAGIVIPGELTNAGLSELLETNTFRPSLRHAFNIEDMWPLLLLVCGGVFLADVFTRRVAMEFGYLCDLVIAIGLFTALMGILNALISWSGGEGFSGYLLPLVIGLLITLLGTCLSFLKSAKDGYFRRLIDSRRTTGSDNQAGGNIARLQSRKAEIEKQIETRRAATKFEPDQIDEKISGKQRLDEIIGSEIDKSPERLPKIKRDKSLDIEKDTSYTSRLLDAKRKAQEKQKRNENGENED